MFDERSIKLDICALALLALTVFLGIALWTYDHMDPPSTLVYPARESFSNACGRSGAYAAHFLLESLGIGAYYAAASLTILTILLVARREINQPILRTIGWAISLVGVTALAALSVPDFTPGPVIGAGGYVGAMGRSLLQQHFAVTGAYVFTLTLFLVGLLLCTDYMLLKLLAFTTIFGGRGLVTVGRMGHSAAARRTRRKTDLDLVSGQDGGAEGECEDDEYEEDEYEYEDDEYEDDELEDEAEDENDEEYEDEDEYDEEEEVDDEEEEPSTSGIRVRTPSDRGDDGLTQNPADTPSDSSSIDPESPSAATAVAAGLAQGLKSALGIKPKSATPTPAEKPSTKPAPASAADEKQDEREEIIQQLEAADQEPQKSVDYELPPLDLLLPADEVCYEAHEREVRRKAKVLEKTFQNFGFNVRVVEIETGPVIAQFEIQLEAGLRLSRITGLADDLAIALRVPSVRIVAPIPGKNTVGIEVPNENREVVRLREVIEETNGRAKRMKIPIFLGKDVAGNPMVVDLASLPHLLIAGRTGTGKSVCLNSIIVSMLMGRGPDEVRMLMIDPKMVELSGYRKLPHLMHPVVTDMRKAEAILAWAVDKMEERYQLLARAGVRHVSVYNQLGDDELRDRVTPTSDAEWEQIPKQLPFIVIVADEMADLMMTAGKDVEQHIIRLAQKSRAVGIHLILATQKPTVDVITGLIKSNLPARIAFQVASRTDSRVVLDEMGADKLLGNGDMLFLSPGTSMLLRGQGTYLSDDEITSVVDFVGTDDPQFASELLELKTKEDSESSAAGNIKNRDELYGAAVDVVVRERRGSVSLLQRALGIGYGRAARLVDFMAEDRIVGEYNGAQAREVLISLEDWEAMNNETEGGDADQPATVVTTRTDSQQSRRINRIVPAREKSRGQQKQTDDPGADDAAQPDVGEIDTANEIEDDEESDRESKSLAARATEVEHDVAEYGDDEQHDEYEDDEYDDEEEYEDDEDDEYEEVDEDDEYEEVDEEAGTQTAGEHVEDAPEEEDDEEEGDDEEEYDEEDDELEDDEEGDYEEEDDELEGEELEDEELEDEEGHDEGRHDLNGDESDQDQDDEGYEDEYEEVDEDGEYEEVEYEDDAALDDECEDDEDEADEYEDDEYEADEYEDDEYEDDDENSAGDDEADVTSTGGDQESDDREAEPPFAAGSFHARRDRGDRPHRTARERTPRGPRRNSKKQNN